MKYVFEFSILQKVDENRIIELFSSYFKINTTQVGNFMADIENQRIVIGLEFITSDPPFKTFVNGWARANWSEIINLRFMCYLGDHLDSDILIPNLIDNDFEFMRYRNNVISFTNEEDLIKSSLL